MTGPTDKVSVFLRVGVYIFLYLVVLFLLPNLLIWLGGYFFGGILSQFAAAIWANWVALRIYGRLRLVDLGLQWNRSSARNLALGFAGGIGAAALVLLPPLAAHLARIGPSPQARATWDVFLFTAATLLLGSAGEEILFRGYGFQMLFRVWGPHATIFMVGALFAVLHGGNPNSSWLGLLNTAGFGILFGYAFLRSGDLWLPIGLHFGWNFTLPLFGANVSGLTIKMSGYEMQWSAGPLWSGGEYGPEGSILIPVSLLALAVFLWKAPIRKQELPLLAG
jgi:membrane protease YdiL (CAAX protease family)